MLQVLIQLECSHRRHFRMSKSLRIAQRVWKVTMRQMNSEILKNFNKRIRQLQLNKKRIKLPQTVIMIKIEAMNKSRLLSHKIISQLMLEMLMRNRLSRTEAPMTIMKSMVSLKKARNNLTSKLHRKVRMSLRMRESFKIAACERIVRILVTSQTLYPSLS